MRNDRADIAIETMDSCRISWGRVVKVGQSELVVARAQLVQTAGKLALSEPRAYRVSRQLDGRGFVDDVKAGDVVSIHWSWACEVLDDGARSRLRRATARSMSLANLTI